MTVLGCPSFRGLLKKLVLQIAIGSKVSPGNLRVSLGNLIAKEEPGGGVL